MYADMRGIRHHAAYLRLLAPVQPMSIHFDYLVAAGAAGAVVTYTPTLPGWERCCPVLRCSARASGVAPGRFTSDDDYVHGMPDSADTY